MSYSLGGIDYPLGYGTALPAPASGTLRISGGRGEFAAGEVGSAGRRSILTLDKPILGLVAIVWQHQSRFADPGHYNEGETSGWSGASANGNDWGGDVHLHTHGLLESGIRVDWRGYIALAGGSSVAGNYTELEEIDMATAEEIAEALVPAIWKYMLIQPEGAKAEGRAADWLTNLPDQVGPNVWGEELTHPNGTHAPASKWLMNTSDMVGAILSKPSSVIDTVKLAAALKAGGLTVTIDQAALVKAIDASLSDNFAAIPGAVRDNLIK
ncbi:hypothetical protein [Cryobacterium soli]|uniref:hypothetical protein n=1 Tax=Cryobacterium soli TaxID=2220095 RepID=UPI000E7560B8|nr:hypothetical protein [Cryobacterium soli]